MSQSSSRGVSMVWGRYQDVWSVQPITSTSRDFQHVTSSVHHNRSKSRLTAGSKILARLGSGCSSFWTSCTARHRKQPHSGKCHYVLKSATTTDQECLPIYYYLLNQRHLLNLHHSDLVDRLEETTETLNLLKKCISYHGRFLDSPSNLEVKNQSSAGRYICSCNDSC